MMVDSQKQLEPHAMNVNSANTHISTNLPLAVKIFLGGSFDPVHNSHIQMLYHASRQLSETRLAPANSNQATAHLPQPDITSFFLPTSRSPLKDNSSEPKHRINMLNLAIDSMKDNIPDIFSDKQGLNSSASSKLASSHALSFEICEHEIWQQPPTYTIDTLTDLRAQYPNCSLIFILGADNIANLDKWRDGKKLTEYAHLWIIPRNDLQTHQDIMTLLPTELKAQVTHSLTDLNYYKHGLIYIDNVSIPDISSTSIRHAFKNNAYDVTKTALPPSIYSYIIKNKLY